ncbi:hypothetical protein D3C84_947530 [compost metagenome]
MIESDVHAVLLAAPAVAALVGDRVAAGMLPEGELRPYVTYSLVTGERIGSMTDSGLMRHVRLQLDCWSPNYKQAKQIALAVQDAMEASALFEVVFVGDQDLYDDETKLQRVLLDYSVWQVTA